MEKLWDHTFSKKKELLTYPVLTNDLPLSPKGNSENMVLAGQESNRKEPSKTQQFIEDSKSFTTCPIKAGILEL